MKKVENNVNKITDPEILHDEFIKIGFKETTYEELKSWKKMELNMIEILAGKWEFINKVIYFGLYLKEIIAFIVVKALVGHNLKMFKNC